MPAELVNNLPKIILSLNPKAKLGLKAAADMIAEKAKERVPVGLYPPHLRDAIHVEELDGEEMGYSVVAGDEKVFWGHMIEFGTTKQPARPFLLPAAESTLVVATVGTTLKL